MKYPEVATEDGRKITNVLPELLTIKYKRGWGVIKTTARCIFFLFENMGGSGIADRLVGLRSRGEPAVAPAD